MGRRASGFDCINTSDQPPDLARINMVMIRALSDRSNSPTNMLRARAGAAIVSTGRVRRQGVAICAFSQSVITVI